MGNSFGKFFTVTTFGESHGQAVGCIIDGCPSQVKLSQKNIMEFLDKRRPGQSAYTSPRKESDTAEILSGVENGITLGTPICIAVKNTDVRKKDYSDIEKVFRPSHGDFTTLEKYGVTSASGGGRVSARETVGRVAAAAVARALLNKHYPKLCVLSWVERIGNVTANCSAPTTALIEKSILRCPDTLATKKMQLLIEEAKTSGDTLGGLIKTSVVGVPVGWGAPVFDKLEACLAKAMLSIPATKSFEIGSGIAGTYMKGSEHNDAFIKNSKNEIKTKTNFSGGIQAGISNGMPIEFSVGFKPVSTLFREQETVTKKGKQVKFSPQSGRHDVVVLPRAVPIVEAMTWLVLVDYYLQQKMMAETC